MDIAIIGMAGRFPEAENIEQFYRNLRMGRDSVRKISVERLRSTTVPLNEDYQVAAYMENIDRFDHDFFHISMAEAKCMDPHHRFMLEVAYQAFENAGYDPQTFNGSRTAVFVGDFDAGYLQHAEEPDLNLLTGNLNSALAGRISRVFNLRGAALMLDTTCSSSLVALHYACREIANGDADLALACGVRIGLFPDIRHRLNQAGIKSPEGRSKTFSASADGIGVGEAAVCVLLKPLGKALADGDLVHAVIKGSAVNQDAGLSGSLTAPSGTAQAEVIQAAWKSSGIDPETISYIETHGTGTKLGDPIEIQGLTLAFTGHSERRQFCAISSVKTNVGHTDGAAGIVGLVKATLSLKHRELFPSLHFDQPNPLIDFAGSPVFVNNQLRDWTVPGDRPRRAGVSSFGITGTNCHVVLEEAPARAGASRTLPGKDYLIPLSAKNEVSLRQAVVQLADHLRTRPETSIRDLSYTLCAGRAHHPHRFAAIAASVAAVLQVLDEYTAGRKEESKTFLPETVVFIFSDGNTLPWQLTADGYPEWPGLAAELERGRNTAGADYGIDAVRALCSQYAFYQTFHTKGIRSDALAGIGTGEIVVDIITGQLSLADGIAKVKRGEYRNTRDVTARSADIVRRVGGGPVLFVEPGPGGNLSQALATEGTDDKDRKVVTLTEKDQCSLGGFVRSLYLAGFTTDWPAFWAGDKGERIELPAYPFRRTRCWLKEPAGNKPEDAFFDTAWVRQETAARPRPLPTQTWLVFMDEGGIGDAVSARLAPYAKEVIPVRFGSAYEAHFDGGYTIGNSEEDYSRLLMDLMIADKLPGGIVHLGNCGDQAPLQRDNVDRLLEKGFYSQFNLTKVFDYHLSENDVDLILVSTNALRVVEGDDPVHPAKSSSFGYIRGLIGEYERVRARAVDFAPDAGQTTGDIADAIMHELLSDEEYVVAAWRGKHRYIQTLVPVSGKDLEQPVKEGGVYIVTGGAGGIGYEVAKWLAAKQPVHLILVGRTVLPTGEKAKNIADLAATGSGVQYISCDMSKDNEVGELITTVRNRHGRINGIVHSAALPGVKRIKQNTLPEIKTIIGSRVYGMLSLLKWTEDDQPDFMVIFSSIASIMASFARKADYNAGSILADTYIRELGRSRRFLKVINWCDWQETGMTFRINENPEEFARKSSFLNVRSADGIALLDRFLQTGLTNLIPLANLELISKDQLKYMQENPYFLFEQDRQRDKEKVKAEAPAEQPSSPAKETRTVKVDPDATETEKGIALIWAEALLLDKVGREDNFFDLGGQSLIGFSVLNRIEEKFRVQFSMEDLFDFPELGRLARHIDVATGNDSPKNDYHSIPALALQPHYEISHAQRRLWMLNQIEKDLTAYHLNGSFGITGHPDTAAFQQAFRALIRRHESLRTTFAFIDNEPRQLIHDYGGEQLEYIDLRDDPDPVGHAARIAHQRAATPFDQEKGPLIRAALLRTGQENFAFIYNMDHIIGDGWSTLVLLKELLGLYIAFKEGREDPLIPLRIHYKDFSAWQNNLFRQREMSTHREYWLNQFAGDIPVLDPGSDHRRPRIKTYNGASINTELSRATCERLEAFSRRNGVTLFITLLSILKTLFYRYTGQTDIVLGSPTAGRDHKDLENQIGFYLNTLALRTRFGSEDRFTELLARVKKTVLSGFEHQIYPFDLLVEDLNMKMDISRSPLFDVLVILENLQSNLVRIEKKAAAEEEKDHRHDETMAKFYLTATTSMYDLTIGFTPREDGSMNFSLQYNTDLFSRDRMERMARHFNRLTGSILDDPGRQLWQYDLLTPEEEGTLNGFNDNRVDLSASKTLTVLLRTQAMLNGEKIALRCGSRNLSYGELDTRANELASILMERWSLHRGDVVMILLHRSIELVESIVAVWKAGGAYIPASPSDPVQRILDMARDAGVKGIITDTRCLAGYGSPPETEIPWLILDTLDRTDSCADDPGVRVDHSDLAYVIYTSGSTGKPKGAMIEHAGMLNHLLAKIGSLQIDGDSVIAQTASQCFDISVWQSFAALAAGGTTVIYDNEEVLDAESLLSQLDDDGVTLIEVVPSYLRLLLDIIEKQGYGARSRVLRSLRYMVVTGEVLDAHLARRWFSLFRNIPLINAYGPTEAADDITQYRMDKSPEKEEIPIGKALPNCAIYILDEHGNRCPLGVRGEICVSGIGVGRGYLNDPDRTDKVFVNDPFEKDGDMRMYKTGDTGLYLADGNILFYGRKDHQVKIKGHRIELGEIEHALLSIRGISQAVVLDKEDAVQGKSLAAFVCLDGETPLGKSEIVAALGKRLPSYMVPGNPIIVDRIPLTVNGKVDRRSLLQQAGDPDERTPYVAPRNGIEETLSAAWEEVLGKRPIGINDNFFEIGGDSIRTIRVFNIIRKEFPGIVRIADLFVYGTIASLAEYISGRLPRPVAETRPEKKYKKIEL
jgi:amino acid adenylation domain-containing protein